MRILLAPIIGSILLLASTIVPAHQVEAVAQESDADDALGAYRRGDFATAMRLFLPRAQNGDAKAQNNVGIMFFDGNGVKKDRIEALQWFRKAAERGLPEAQLNLGESYFDGEGVSRDYIEALKRYRKAADQGSAVAQNNIGAMYAKGEGVGQDSAEAAKWYRKAADLGLDAAQNNLAHMYFDGRGVTQNYEEAAKWYRKAADQGFAAAQYSLGALFYQGKGVPQDRVEAARWFHEAAKQGNAIAQNNLGEMYYFGIGVGRDLEEAIKWWRRSADQGNPEAENHLAEIDSRLQAPNIGLPRPAPTSPSVEPQPFELPAQPQSEGDLNSQSSRCDAVAFLAMASYNAKLSGAPYAKARQFMLEQLRRAEPPDAANNTGYQNFKAIILNLVAEAYSTSWANAQAFSDHKRAICLGLE